MSTSGSGRRCPRSSRCACFAAAATRKTSRCVARAKTLLRPPKRWPAIVTPMSFPMASRLPIRSRRFLPDSVHGPAEIVDPTRFAWSDSTWRGVDLRDYVIYELHIGTFTPEGTLDSAARKLEYLKRLGITVVEIMPVAACPGRSQLGLRRRLAVRGAGKLRRT